MNDYYLTESAARFLRPFLPDAIPESPCGRVRIVNSPETVSALQRALETARARGIRSSLRAALSRFSPESVRPRAKPATRVFLLWKRRGARKYKVQGTATAEGSIGTVSTLVRSAMAGRGRLRVIEADSADDARERIARFEAGESIGMTAGIGAETHRKESWVLGIGTFGALAVWSSTGPESRSAWTGTGAAIEPETIRALRWERFGVSR